MGTPTRFHCVTLMFIRSALLLILVYSSALAAPDRVPAFPGAEGFGAATPGGRGGKIFEVTTLQDYDKHSDPIPGSLRAAVEADGPRMIVFAVGGTIDLKQPLVIRHPFLTLAGQSAPGGGVCLRRYNLVILTHDVILRYLRVRPGDLAGKALDAISIGTVSEGVADVIVDHCSTSWATDETISTAGRTKNVTVQWCILGEALSHSAHPKGEHSKGSIIGGHDGGITFHHNLYAHITTRNPKAGTEHVPPEPGVTIDFVNNVIYDWGGQAGYSATQQRVRLNYVGNYLRPGPYTPAKQREYAFHPGSMTQIYLANNALHEKSAPTTNNALMITALNKMENLPAAHFLVSRPWPAPPVRTATAAEAFVQVLANAGASLPLRDAVDARIINQVRNGTGRIIDSQNEVPGWPDLPPGQALADADHDGIPDAWELSHHLNPKDRSDASVVTPDGYTPLEHYLNSL
jgi:pectate lyase